MELGPRLKSLPYKIKAMSRETAAQKASHILDPDLRNYWSTGTNTKEWILLELQEPCLLSHVRIHNKSVLEWEVTAGLRYKPEIFVKVRSRCEAPRRDMTYSTNYTPTRYIRISCLRGSPIAIFFVQLIGIPMPRLEPEFQPVIDHLLPQFMSHEQDSRDLHLQLLQDIINSLHGFLPQLESELTNFAEAPEVGLRFLAMLAGPFNPILQVVSQREFESSSIGSSEASRNSLPSPSFKVSSNFEPRRSHTSSPTTSKSTAFHPDTVFMLLRKAIRESDLATLCKIAARVFHHLAVPNSAEVSVVNSEIISSAKEEPLKHGGLSDYSGLFGEDLSIPADEWDSSFINLLDLAAVEEGILHVLYACACEPLLCHKLAESTSDFWLALPLIQALLPALRPLSCPPAAKDSTFSQWMQPLVQQALSKIVLTLSSQAFHPLLRACAGYLSSFSPAHVKTACVLIDLCSGVLEPWMPQVISKVDLTMELLADLLGVVQGGEHPSIHARSAMLYIILALSGYMDDLMAKFKEVKHSILFLMEMLEKFLQPVFSLSQPMIDLRNVSELFLMSEEHNCAVALNVIRAAVRKPSILPYLELEWRRGSVPLR